MLAAILAAKVLDRITARVSCRDLHRRRSRAKRRQHPYPLRRHDSVGTGKMSADGAIALRIRSLWYQPVAERRFVYAPDDPQYDAIKRHLGGKPVPPLCGVDSGP